MKRGQKLFGKPIGSYVTIDIKKLKIMTTEELEEVANSLASELKELISAHIGDMDEVLVVRAW